MNDKVKTFYDTEFMEASGEDPAELLSIGMVREDGAELYLQNQSARLSRANDWVRANVLPLMQGEKELYTWLPISEIRKRVFEFCGPYPEFWGYFAWQDHALLSSLMGDMGSWPRGWPFYTLDIMQYSYHIGSNRRYWPAHEVEKYGPPHHALADARWTKAVYEFLLKYDTSRDYAVVVQP